MESTLFIQDLAIVLLVAGALGWVAQRLGLSAVAGFLVAGIVAGPATPPFALVADAGRIRTLAEIGLVFLMFSIGLRLSLRRLQRFGFTLLVAVAVSALLMYHIARVGGAVAGYDPTQTLFLAAMLMVSSSAIISKVLQETGATHERAGQLAMGMTVLEDVVAVVMLTVLNSVVHFGGAGGGPPVWETLGLLGAFVVLTGIAGLLLVPALLRRMSIVAGEELQTLGIAGLLFGLALLAERAGYSLALGAFLLGTIVAETPHRHQVERIFEGMRDVFSAVFFVAIGLQIDVRDLGGAWLLIAGMTVVTWIGRPLAAATALTLVGNPLRDALRTGLILTPIGEFSFIIAQLGIAAAVVPDEFYPLAVGMSLATTFLAPWLTRHSAPVSDWIAARQPRWLETSVRYYHEWLERTALRQRRNVLWRLSRKRFIQVGVEMLFVSGLLVFSEQIFRSFETWVGRDWLFPHGPAVVFWAVLALVVLAPLVAIWRNVSALALLYAEVTTSSSPDGVRLRPIVAGGMRLLAAAGLWMWLAALLPLRGGAGWLIASTLLVALAALALLRRKLVYWHSEMEVTLQGVLAEGVSSGGVTSAPFLRDHAEWNLTVVDCTIPDLADCAGRSIADLQLRSRLGCTVVGIERQGVLIPLPGPQREIFPRDRVLLMGTAAQVKEGIAFLGGVSGAAPGSEFDELRMESVAVPAGSRVAGRTLADLALAQQHGVQVAGIERGARRTLNPGGEEVLCPGDGLLALGTMARLREFSAWMKERAGRTNSEGES